MNKKMKIVQINGGVYGSAGNIMFQIAETARASGHEVICFSPVTQKKQISDKSLNYINIGSYYGRKINYLLDFLFSKTNFFSVFETFKLIKQIEAFDPDVIHLHTMHGAYVNLGIFFKFLKKYSKKIIITLHDCWMFTGRCYHFTISGCKKWKTGCAGKCPYGKMNYPMSLTNSSRRMMKYKINCYDNLQNVTIITPSEWLAGLAKQSILKKFEIKVINNGIDLSIFRPLEMEHDKRFTLIGVSYGWSYNKGLDLFIRLAEILDESYRIILVGTDDNVDKLLPKNIESIHRTDNQEELVKLYNQSDLFIQTTRQDTFPTVNIEALACGLPVITFSVCGSPEIIDSSCGVCVNDFDSLVREIKRQKETRHLKKENCLARSKKYDRLERFQDYVRLYEKE